MLLIRHQQAVLCCLVLYSLSHSILEGPSIMWVEPSTKRDSSVASEAGVLGNLMEVLVCIAQHGRDMPSERIELCQLRILRLQFNGDACFIMSPKVTTVDYVKHLHNVSNSSAASFASKALETS